MEVMPVCVLFKKRMAKKSWASSHFFVLFGKWETTPASVWNMQAYMETVSKCHGLGEWQYFLTVLHVSSSVFVLALISLVESTEHSLQLPTAISSVSSAAITPASWVQTRFSLSHLRASPQKTFELDHSHTHLDLHDLIYSSRGGWRYTLSAYLHPQTMSRITGSRPFISLPNSLFCPKTVTSQCLSLSISCQCHHGHSI